MQQRDSVKGYLVAVAQMGGGSSVLNILCAKDQANENEAQVRYLADFPVGYEGDSSAHFPHCFFLPSFSSSIQGLEPGQNPWCLASGPNEAQALMSHCKNPVRDTAIKGEFVQIQREEHSARCGPLQMASPAAMECGVASLCQLDEFIC